MAQMAPVDLRELQLWHSAQGRKIGSQIRKRHKTEGPMPGPGGTVGDYYDQAPEHEVTNVEALLEDLKAAKLKPEDFLKLDCGKEQKKALQLLGYPKIAQHIREKPRRPKWAYRRAGEEESEANDD
jgi:hypothetical protein